MSRGSRSLTLYTRAGCHLCDDMLARVWQVLGTEAGQLRLVDVDSDPDLRSEFGERVPVLVGDAGEICHYFLDEQALFVYLEGR